MPSVTKVNVVPPSNSSGAGMVGQHEDGCVEGRIVAPPAVPRVVLRPRPRPAPEHAPAHHGRADVRLLFLDHGRAGVHLAAVLPLLVAPCLELDNPSMQVHASDAKRVLLTLVGAGDESHPSRKCRSYHPA